ncbi:MAG TPA: hypothetical protein DDZ83_15505 [Nitrospinae bacterium]|nr:hypothetical protein [Nitrospinota bacterium]
MPGTLNGGLPAGKAMRIIAGDADSARAAGALDPAARTRKMHLVRRGGISAGEIDLFSARRKGRG